MPQPQPRVAFYAGSFDPVTNGHLDVVRHACRIADRLIVADASLFPTPIGVNPMESIMALATRAAAHVIDNPRRFVS